MPIQPLAGNAALGAAGDVLTWPRATLLLSSAAAVAIYAHVLYQVLSIVQLTLLQGVFLVLCTLCFAWIAFNTCSAVIGAIAIIAARRRPCQADTDTEGGDRTALLFPVYQEDAAGIATTIEAIARELIALRADRSFDVFLLSDSRQQDSKARELRAVRFLRRRLQGGLRIYYRARSENVGKKAGNIADWVRRFGGAYQSFVILDADSVMSGTLLVRLRRAMANNPTCGLLQTVPRLVGAETLLARLQQFAVAFYGPLVAAGFAAWHQQSGNYWGHNAIVRTAAFAAAGGLPHLPGRPPFGGHVQSHDFVEAAFLRRAGWDVRLLVDRQGSYERCPPTLVDVAVRDRRWAQGNLQHLRIIAASGLPWVSRLHLAMGSYAYLASVLWALSLLVGVVLALESAYTLPVYFADTKTLFPIWPVIDPTKALYLFLGTVIVVLLPKALAIVLAVAAPDRQVPRPALPRFLTGVLLEMLFSILIAPILMLTQTHAVSEIVRGKDSGWSVQRRDGSASDWRQLLRFHFWHMLLGAALATACALASTAVLAWMSPIVVGLLLSVAISHATSKPAPAWVARALATPEDISPPPIVAAVRAGYPQWATLLAKRAALWQPPALGQGAFPVSPGSSP
jgi:membrane glycosyltransferase